MTTVFFMIKKNNPPKYNDICAIFFLTELLFRRGQKASEIMSAESESIPLKITEKPQRAAEKSVGTRKIFCPPEAALPRSVRTDNPYRSGRSGKGGRFH